MKTSFMLLAVTVALAASFSDASGTLGSSAVAATAPSRIDSSAGSQMGPAEAANVDPNAPTKPGSVPVTVAPSDGGNVAGGVAGGFSAESNATESSSATEDTSVTEPKATTLAPTSTPAPTSTKSGAASLGAASVVTVLSVASTVAALSW